MQLTRGQKEAIARKADAIVDEKREELKKKYIASYKPTKEVKDLLKKCEELTKLRKQYRELAEKLSFTFNSSYLSFTRKFGNNNKWVSIYHNSDKAIEEELGKFIMNEELNSLAEKENVKFPSYNDIIDEIELQYLSKSFDLEAFLNKYRNL